MLAQEWRGQFFGQTPDQIDELPIREFRDIRRYFRMGGLGLLGSCVPICL